MIKINEYFEGKVKSFELKSGKDRKTVGVITPGEYEFDTKSKETMTVIVGEISVFLSEYNEWEDFPAGASFEIPAHSKFKIKVSVETAYLCEYE